MEIPKLFFFDNDDSFPFLTRRSRKSTLELPKQLQENRSSETVSNKLDSFLYSKKRVLLLGGAKKKVQTLTVYGQLKGAFAKYIEENADESSTLIKNAKSPETCNAVEDDEHFLFEETKLSATALISELSKYLDIIIEKRKAANELSKVHSQKIAADNYFNFQPTLVQKQKTISKVSLQQPDFFIPKHIVEILSFKFCDLIKETVYKQREWQSQTYKDISNDKDFVSPEDSGIFSVPATAMSGTYENEGYTEDKNKNKRSVFIKATESSLTVVPKVSSSDSGMTSENDVKAKEPKIPTKPKTRFEKYFPEKVNEQPTVSEEVNEEEKGKNILHCMKRNLKVPKPPIKDQMLSFAVSSRECHERGWVVQPLFLNDPENQTLLMLAHARLQKAIALKQEQEKNLITKYTDFSVKYFGDTKRDIAIKYKQGTSHAKRLLCSKNGKLPFMITLPDGTLIIYYESGNIAVVCSSTGHGSYTLVYDDTKRGKLLAYFLPTGRGVCYHKTGKIAFISMEKCGYCHSEVDGSVFKKWKWADGKLIPPLNIELSECITYRCLGKMAMQLSVRINGERAKIKLVDGNADDLNICESGPLLTIEKFTSSTAIQLSTVVFKKKDEKKGPKKAPLSTAENERTTVNDKQVRDKHEEAVIKRYRNDLKTLQNNIKNIVDGWMDRYRIAIGLKLTHKSAMEFYKQSSAKSLPSHFSTFSLDDKTKSKMPRLSSAPPRSTCLSSARHAIVNRPYSSRLYEKKSKDNECEETTMASLPITTLPISGVRLASPPFKCGVPQNKSEKYYLFSKKGCPVVLRAQLLNENEPRCRCTKRKVPVLTDVEYDELLSQLPKTQLIIVSIVTVGCNPSNVVDGLLDELHHDLNKNRVFPCGQSAHDAYRLFRYSVPPEQERSMPPLLVKRHNVKTGMFMMYQGGRLLFADFIFDGYANTKKDFLKQISRTRKEALRGLTLPGDFFFLPKQSLRQRRKATVKIDNKNFSNSLHVVRESLEDPRYVNVSIEC